MITIMLDDEEIKNSEKKEKRIQVRVEEDLLNALRARGVDIAKACRKFLHQLNVTKFGDKK